MTNVTSSSAPTDGLAIALRGLRKSYGSHVALAGLDLSVPEGVVYGFLGPNGAGKTTTMRLLTGLIHPDAGSIELLGRPFERGDRRRLFDVGALIETPSFYPYLSGRENLRALAATGAPVSPPRTGELLELVGLTDRAGDAVSTYSLGMKQRLGIASALLSDPTLLLLDEPANGLDPAGIVALRDTLKQLAASGKTIFVSSHILGEVRELADVVGIIAAGRLVREGPMETLLQEGGAVRVRVAGAEVARARTALAGLAGADGVSSPREADAPAWLSVRLPHERAAEVNRALAEAGIYASGLETESTLEALFLELTGGQPPSGREGTFQGVGAAKPVGGNGEPGGPTDEGQA
jgi:ABC-2 type transport system ATP-binding protein